jgi:hypothetical protein
MGAALEVTTRVTGSAPVQQYTMSDWVMGLIR